MTQVTAVTYRGRVLRTRPARHRARARGHRAGPRPHDVRRRRRRRRHPSTRALLGARRHRGAQRHQPQDQPPGLGRLGAVEEGPAGCGRDQARAGLPPAGGRDGASRAGRHDVHDRALERPVAPPRVRLHRADRVVGGQDPRRQLDRGRGQGPRRRRAPLVVGPDGPLGRGRQVRRAHHRLGAERRPGLGQRRHLAGPRRAGRLPAAGHDGPPGRRRQQPAERRRGQRDGLAAALGLGAGLGARRGRARPAARCWPCRRTAR